MQYQKQDGSFSNLIDEIGTDETHTQTNERHAQKLRNSIGEGEPSFKLENESNYKNRRNIINCFNYWM